MIRISLWTVWSRVCFDSFGGRMSRIPTILTLAVLALPGCQHKGAAPPALQVVDALPQAGAGASREWGSRSHPIPLYLNSKIQVEFSEQIDHLTVTSDTVRVMKVVPDGPPQVTPIAKRRLGTRSVTLLPEWPLTADLDDGSLVPGQLYRLEVRGFPLSNTVRSKTGVGVEGFVRYYRTVDRDSTDPGPLLPVGTPMDPFKVRGNLGMALDNRTARLHFTTPPHPATVTPGGLDFIVTRAGEEIRLGIAATRVLTERRPIWEGDASSPGGQRMRWSYPASTVEIRLRDDVVLNPGEDFWVHLKPANPQRPGDTSHWIRDYRGNPVSLEINQSYVMGRIYAGDMVELCRYPGVAGARGMVQADGNKLSFEVHRDSRSWLRPMVRREAGRGTLGIFHPQRSMILQPQVPFDRGDGVTKFCRGRFEFSSVFIPKGVTVTLRSRDPVELLSSSGIHIEGELRLETPRARAPEGVETGDLDSYLQAVAKESFGARLLAAGPIRVDGVIRHQLVGNHLPPPVAIVTSQLSMARGRIPLGSVVAAGSITGEAQDLLQVRYSTVVGLPPAVHRMQAAAWTPWQALPDDFMGSIDARCRRLEGALEVFLQVAPPDPVDPGLPYVEATSLREPRKLPLRSPVEVGRNSHVRFLLKAKVIQGKPLPSVESLVILSPR